MSAVTPECPTCECRRVVLGGYPPTAESMKRRDVAWCQSCRVERPIGEFLAAGETP